MNLGGIIGWLVALGISGLLLKMGDKILLYIWGKINAERALDILLDRIRWLDDHIIDKLKKKTPEFGRKIENLLVAELRKAADIIEDKS